MAVGVKIKAVDASPGRVTVTGGDTGCITYLPRGTPTADEIIRVAIAFGAS